MALLNSTINLSSSESEYEIEEIVKHRKRGGELEYYVTWKGFDESEDQWVKESDIHATAMLEDYKKNMLKRKPSTKKSGSTTLTRKTSSRSAKTKAMTTMMEGGSSQESVSYDYVENQNIFDKAVVTSQQSQKVTRIQESGDIASSMSESSDLEMETPMVTRTSSTVSRTIIQQIGDAGAESSATSASLDDSITTQKSYCSCEGLSLMIFISCFLFAILSIVAEKQGFIQ